MPAERLNHETPASDSFAAQPDAAAGYGGSHETNSEKKNRRRKKNKRKNRDDNPRGPLGQEYASGGQPEGSVDGPKKERRVPFNILSLDDDTVMLWQRPETGTSAVKADGEKTFGIGDTADTGKPSEADDMPGVGTTTAPEPQAETPVQAVYEADVPQPGQTSDSNETPPHYEPYRPYGPAAAPPLPMPPDPMSYRRSFWKEQPSPAGGDSDGNRSALPPIYEYEQAVRQVVPENITEQYQHAPASNLAVEGPAPVPQPGKFESDIPPGLQRSPADVSRAAWTGVLAGWWIGRRGKRKAVKKALEAGKQSTSAQSGRESQPQYLPEQYKAPQLEAQPMHNYPAQESARTTVQPVSVEIHRPAEAAARPEPRAAAVVAFERIRPRGPAESAPVPAAARMAAAKATEAMTRSVRAPEAVEAAGARPERQLGKHELMKIAKDIKVDGVSLKDVYSANRIDEEGLRAVVDAYLRGGDVRQQLSREVIAKEQSFERDPRVRHHRISASQGRKERSSKAGEAIGKAWGHTKEIVGEQGSKLAVSSQKTAKKASKVVAKGAKQAQHELIDNSSTTGWLLITGVVVVYSIILLILVG